MNKLPTPNWALLKHALDSFGITVIVTFVIGLGQALSTGSLATINWQTIGAVAGGTFLGAILKNYPALIPQVTQAFTAPVAAPAASPVAVHVYPASGSPTPMAQVDQAPVSQPVQVAFPPTVNAAATPQPSYSSLADYRSQVTRFNESQIVPTVQPPRQ